MVAKAKETAAECAADLGAVGLTFKNPAFREEREWRIIHTPMRMGPGEMEFHGAVTDVHYRASGGNVVAYFPFSFSATPKPAIKEVVLGPKNDSSWATIRGVLAANEFLDVRVKKSVASYR